jgi:hypothetical protein
MLVAAAVSVASCGCSSSGLPSAAERALGNSADFELLSLEPHSGKEPFLIADTPQPTFDKILQDAAVPLAENPTSVPSICNQLVTYLEAGASAFFLTHGACRR